MVAPAAPPPNRVPQRLGSRLHGFWHRVSEGQALDQLWTQFKTDARSSYRLYSRDVDRDALQGLTRFRRFRRTAGQFFWSVLNKLTPARRILLLAGLVLLFLPGSPAQSDSGGYGYPGWAWFGGMLVLVVLVMELADRVIMKRDLQIAREIQTWLVPARAPQIAKLDLAFATRPANTVAGDYYDIIPWYPADADPAQQHTLIVVADVAGKSVPAALLMATLQASIRTLINGTTSLLDLTAGVNRYACAHSSGGQRFTTAILVDYDPVARTLTYVNAGHNAPVLRSATTIERLDVGGMPLGILPDVVYEQQTRAVYPGDVLTIFTDGVVEAENERMAEFGEARLLAYLAAARGTAQEMLNGIMAQVEAFVAGAPQHDDITCLIASFR